MTKSKCGYNRVNTLEYLKTKYKKHLMHAFAVASDRAYS